MVSLVFFSGLAVFQTLTCSSQGRSSLLPHGLYVCLPDRDHPVQQRSPAISRHQHFRVWNFYRLTLFPSRLG